MTAVAITAVVALATAGTLAIFTDTSTSTPSTFSTGEITLSNDNPTGIVTFTTGGMMPGDTASGDVTLTNGAPDTAAFTRSGLRYAITVEVDTAGTDGTLADSSANLVAALTLMVRTTSDGTTSGTCGTGVGTPLYDSDFDGAGSATPSPGKRVVDSPAIGRYTETVHVASGRAGPEDIVRSGRPIA